MAATSDRDPGKRLESEIFFRPQDGPATIIGHARYNGLTGRFSMFDPRTEPPGGEFNPRHATGRVFLDKFITETVNVPDNMTMLTHDVTLDGGVSINLGVNSTQLVL